MKYKESAFEFGGDVIKRRRKSAESGDGRAALTEQKGESRESTHPDDLRAGVVRRSESRANRTLVWRRCSERNQFTQSQRDRKTENGERTKKPRQKNRNKTVFLSWWILVLI